MLKFDDLNLMVAFVYLAQALIGITLSVIFRHFSALYKQRFLGTWSVGWVFFAVAMIAFFFLTTGFARMPANRPVGMLISWTSIAFSYMHIFMLVVGTIELLGDTRIRKKKKFVWLSAIAILSLFIIFLFYQNPQYSAYRYLARVGVRYAITAVCLIGIGVALLRKRNTGIGYKLMSGSLIMFGFLQSYYCYVVFANAIGSKAAFPALFGIFDLILISGVGMGMLIGLLEDERTRLDKANKEMDSFLYSTSHDLRAPIASILGLVNLAKLELKDETTQKYFVMVENRVKKMDSVISDILQLARSTKADLKIEKIDFNQLLQDIVTDVKFNKGAKAIRLNYKPDASHVLFSDHNQLKIIIGNLMANAVKYHNVEQNDPYIAVRFNNHNSDIVIDVEDNGTGIAPEHQNKIFSMFYRASTQSEGTGLGLYIVQEAVAKLRGTVSLKSEKNIGSVFTVRLPKTKQ